MAEGGDMVSAAGRKARTRAAKPAEAPDARVPHTPPDPAKAEAKTARTRDPERTKASILAAATAEFSARGFAGAGIDAIASRSGANRRMIYHYFGSKRGLWLAVLEAAYERARTAELKLDLERLAPEDALRRLVTFTFNSFIGNRTFINLLNSENLHQARHLKESARVKEMHSPLIGMISTILDKGVKAGVFRPGQDPAELWISIAGLSYFYFSNIFTLSVILGRDLASEAELDRRRAHVADLVVNAVLVAPPA